MIPIKDIYDDVVLDNLNAAENGELGLERFNRLSKRAELRLMDYLTGDVENIKPPIPYLAQKNKDWIAPLIAKERLSVTGGKIDRPDNYYGYENMILLGNYQDEDEDGNPVIIEGGNVHIDLLDADEFNARCTTNIAELKPSFKKPIAKEVGTTFEFMPSDLGAVELEYYRYPVFGKAVIKTDTVFNDEVIDEALSDNYEYKEFARELLVYFITDLYSIHTRELALKQTNQATAKLTRG